MAHPSFFEGWDSTVVSAWNFADGSHCPAIPGELPETAEARAGVQGSLRLRSGQALRLRMRIHKANPHASLSMTALLSVSRRPEAALLICALNAALKRRSSTGLHGSVRVPATSRSTSKAADRSVRSTRAGLTRHERTRALPGLAPPRACDAGELPEMVHTRAGVQGSPSTSLRAGSSTAHADS